MKYRCGNCGRIFEEDDIVRTEESRGEFWGMPCYETMYYSPCCKDDFEEWDKECKTIKVTNEMLKSLGRPANANSHEDAKDIARGFGDYDIVESEVIDAEFVYDDMSEIEYTIKY
jgi:hypothetical protein